MISRRSFLNATAVLGLAAAAGCSKDPGEKTPSATTTTSPSSGASMSLTIGLTFIPNIQFSAFYVAKKQGLFDDADLDVTLRHHGAQEDLFSAVLSKQEDIVFCSCDEVVIAAAQGSALQAFALAYQRYPVEVYTNDPAITEMSQLRGKSIGLPALYGSNYYGLLAALSQAGMSRDDVKLVEVGYTQVAALTTKKVDAIVGFSNNERIQFELLKHPVGRIPVQPEDEPVLYGPGLVARPDGVPTEALREVVRVVTKAEQMIAADPKLALEATKEHVPALAEPEQLEHASRVLDASIEMWKKDGTITMAIDRAGFDRMAQFLRHAGVIDQEPGDLVMHLDS